MKFIPNDPQAAVNPSTVIQHTYCNTCKELISTAEVPFPNADNMMQILWAGSWALFISDQDLHETCKVEATKHLPQAKVL